MKRIKKMICLLSAALLFVLPVCSTPLHVSAAEPTTYYVKYMADSGEWRFQQGSAWDDTVQHRELYYMNQDIKDGDIVVVEGKGSALPELKIPVRLSNLTVFHSDFVSVAATSIDNCYVLSDCVAAINGDVTNAYVYDQARCTFNNNVNYLELSSADNFYANVTVMGTVNHLKGINGGNVYYELYSFQAGKLCVEEGYVKTEEAYYSKTASASAPVATAAPSTSTAQTSTSSSSEYDDVPKTGDSTGFLYMGLLGVAALCLTGRYALKKSH